VLVLEGHKIWKSDITVPEAGLSIERALTPAQLGSKVGRGANLKVRCRTQGELRILIDNVDSGATCPNPHHFTVAAGRHTFGLFNPRTGQTTTSSRDVRAGRVTAVLFFDY
jgi:hypothetical protein